MDLREQARGQRPAIRSLLALHAQDVTAEDYKKTLEDYLSKFIGLAEGRTEHFRSRV